MDRALTRFLGVTLVLGLMTSLQLSAACGSDDAADADHDDDHDHDEHADVGKSSGAVCPDDSTLTYESFGEKFMSDHCLRCHSSKVQGAARMGAPADHNFDELAEIQLLAKHIDQKAASGPDSTNVAMPPSDPKPSMQQREQLGEWLACGAP